MAEICFYLWLVIGILLELYFMYLDIKNLKLNKKIYYMILFIYGIAGLIVNFIMAETIKGHIIF